MGLGRGEWVSGSWGAGISPGPVPEVHVWTRARLSVDITKHASSPAEGSVPAGHPKGQFGSPRTDMSTSVSHDVCLSLFATAGPHVGARSVSVNRQLPNGVHKVMGHTLGF